MRSLGSFLLSLAAAAVLSSCQSSGPPLVSMEDRGEPVAISALDHSELNIPRHGRMLVRTTAYTHSEADSLIYGRKTATGSTLRYGAVRSAAADWSRFPVGTIFRIEDDPHTYQVDDYGSALVGTNTIDLYKPTRSAMNQWGARNIRIQVVKWGSYERSLAILDDRCSWHHCRTMAHNITALISERERQQDEG